ncbi:MAG: hypothetical protein J6J39_06180 [Clostridia bacterium]|nr:hypothetical protein [Clostridia bacterium]
MKFKKMLLWVLVLTILAFPVNCITSAEAPQLSMETYVWDASKQANSLANDFEIDDTLTVRIKTDSAINLGGLQIKLEYDSAKFKFVDGSHSYLFTDNYASLMVNTKKSGIISAVFDTTKASNSVNGEFLTFSFNVLGFSADTTADFKLTVVSAFDSTADHNKINLSGSTKTVNLKVANVPADFITLVEKLKTVTAESATDIAAAEEAFAKLTSQQKLAFKQNPLYEVFNSAKSRYNAKVEEAKNAELDKAAKAFVNDNPILKKDLNKVTVADEEAINIVASAYSKLDAVIKNRLSNDIKNKIPALEEALESALQVADFKATYSKIWTLPESDFLFSPGDSIGIVTEAAMIADTLSDMSKAKLTKEIAAIKALKEKLDAVIDADAKQKAIEADAAVYQKVWLKVLTKNVNNVSLGDKTAIELAISEYGKLSDEVKEYLKPKYENLLKLLATVESLEAISPEGGSGEGSNNGGTTETIIKTVTNTKENIITKYLKKNMTKVIYWLLILLAVSVICAVYSYIYHYKLKKKLGLTDENDAEEAIEV